tara:strand:+ start:2133 stop:2384 length:252 start_codon:yes stop_codon:yes gene_type:complete
MSVLVVILSYTTYNLLKKNESQEDTIEFYKNYIENISNVIDFSDKKLKEIDAKETFKSDDEIGFFFDQIKYLQNQLNDFKLKK